DACRAGGASPELLGLRFHPVRRWLRLGLGVLEESGSLGKELIADVEDDLLRVEWLAGRERRAVVGAAPALGAGVAVKELLPGEVTDRRRAEGLLVLDVRDERELPSGGLLSEKDVRKGRDDVQVLRL